MEHGGWGQLTAKINFLKGRAMNRIHSIIALTVLAACALPTLAADLTAQQVKQILSTSKRESGAALARE